MTKPARVVLGALVLSLSAASPARADDLDLLSSSVPPNVMMIFDTSNSMNFVIMHDAFYNDPVDPDGAGALAPLAARQIFWPSACGAAVAGPIAGSRRCPGSTYLVGSIIDGDTDPTNDPCPENDSPYRYDSGTFLAGCGGITLPDYNDVDVTWWPYNYVNWLLPRLVDADASNDSHPQDVRVDAGKIVLADVINQINPNVVDDPNDSSPTYTERVRIGLSHFLGGTGAFVTRGIASGNKVALLSSVSALGTPGGGTPLSEALVDIGRYFAGTRLLCDPSDNTPCYGRYNRTTSGATTSTWSLVPQSPVDLECRKNFVLFLTDGEPQGDSHESTYQDNFETIIGNWDLDGNECDPEVGPQPQTCYQDPDDGRDDGLVYVSGGTDYLDDVAKFLYDYDFSTTLAGKQKSSRTTSASRSTTRCSPRPRRMATGATSPPTIPTGWPTRSPRRCSRSSTARDRSRQRRCLRAGRAPTTASTPPTSRRAPRSRSGPDTCRPSRSPERARSSTGTATRRSTRTRTRSSSRAIPGGTRRRA